MQLDSLIIETRLRSGWSAIDLGFSFVKRFWLRAVCLYLLLASVVYAGTLFLSSDSYLLPYFILWWFKPLFERPILYLLSRELFSEPMPFRRVLREFWHWLKPGFFWIITIRRLSVFRGMYAPISLLEKPSAGNYSPRVSVMGAKHSGEALWLNVVLYHVEMILGLSVILLCLILAPELVDFNDWLSEFDIERNIWIDLSNLLVMAGIAPFYVAGGFMLYISRRVEIEGWDIEIIFRDWMTDYVNSGTDEFRIAESKQ